MLPRQPILTIRVASQDRRPVDPPPIARLRIYDGPSIEDGRDITFDYNANFFLYASLEPDRNAAQGQPGSAPQGESAIVLTGSPVASTAYLDRPELAGYFVFPDLS